MNKVISNKDGRFPAYTGDFTVYSPNTYSVIQNGVEIGSIFQVSNFALKNINPAWSGTDKVWVALIDGKSVAASQYLSEVKKAAKLI
tara:strand:+ start:21 stop:281 length:261 start_codon:yes stop_codon:yes gene_type:complete